jgi:hypothetical protein
MVLIGGQPAGSASLTLNAEQQTPWGNNSAGCITDSKGKLKKITFFLSGLKLFLWRFYL